MSDIDFVEMKARLDVQDDKLVAVKDQALTDEFLTDLADRRFESKRTPADDLHHVASIPEAVVDLWLRQGFDVYRESAKNIVKKLRQENLEAFLATSKSV